MAKIIYNGSFDVNGPFLFELEDLVELDDMITKEWSKLTQFNYDLLAREIERKLNEYKASGKDITDIKDIITKQITESREFRCDKELLIHFSSGNSLVADTFEEAAKEPSIRNELATSFTWNMSVGAFSADISLRQYSDTLSIRTSPKGHDYARDIIYNLQGWARKKQPSLFLRLWKKFMFFQWLVFLVIFLSTTAILAEITSHNPYSKELNREAMTLLENGITNAEQNKAIEILLSKAINYIPPGHETPTISAASTSITILAISLLLAILLSFIPKTSIGIAKGELKVKLWKGWLKIIFITIPTTTILPIINKISNLL